MYGYIYITTINDKNSKLNNYYYIGQHKCKEFDENYFGSGVILNDYIKKNGKDNLICEIIEWAYDKEQLNELEEFYVNNDIINDKLCMNLCTGGKNGLLCEKSKINLSKKAIDRYKNKEMRIKQAILKNDSINNTDERDRISNSLKKRWNMQTNEYKEEYRKKIKERSKDLNTKRKISKSNKGRHFIIMVNYKYI